MGPKNKFFGAEDGAEEEFRSLEGFFKKNKFFAVPWILLAALLYSMHYVPKLEAYFVAHGMQPLGFMEAAKLTIWVIVCSYAVHGWIAVNHDELVKKGLKCVKNVPYDFKSDDASIRCSVILFFGMMVYALVPMRMAPAETWGAAILKFLVGYVILLITGDAWFFLVHCAIHRPSLYKMCHKTHHRWKHPVSFSSYYIVSATHLLQEHCITVPCMLFLPVPWSAFLFYQYYGTVGAMVTHCGFSLEDLHVPFCGPLKLGHLMTVGGLGLGLLLGTQSTADHDYHHKHFIGNYALAYTYLDRLFGSYVDATMRTDAEEGLLGA